MSDLKLAKVRLWNSSLLVCYCRGWFMFELAFLYEKSNSQTNVYNNDWFDKGSYSHQQPLDAEECRNSHSEASTRTTRQLLHRKLTNTSKQGRWDPHTPSRRCTFGWLPQTKSTSSPIQTNDNYLWSTLSTPNRSAFKDVVLNTLLDREKSIRRAAANVLILGYRSSQRFAASRFLGISGKELPRKLPPTFEAKT